MRWVNPKAGYVFQIRMIKVENTTQLPPTQFAAIERNFHETQAGQGLRLNHTPKKVGVRFGVRAISLNCVDLRGPITQKHLYCVEFLRIASRFDSYRKSLPLRIPRVPKCTKMLKTNVLGIFFAQTGVPKCTKMYPLWVA